jgi:hypothetical protein
MREPGALFTSLVGFAVLSATVWATDLSKYRNFQLGTDLPTVAKQAAANPSQAATVHVRPVLIQNLEWHPQPLGSPSQTEPAQDVVFTFYDGKLFRIAVTYDRNDTEGLTADDLVEAMSKTYGMAVKPSGGSTVTEGTYGDREEVLAEWQDPQYRFNLIRSSYGPTYRLVGLLRNLEAPMQAATLEAKRLDDQEAPQREAARIANEDEAAKAKLGAARLVNKPRFRP